MTPPASPASMREERRVVTVLSADLVGSTALGERLDPEEARLVVGEAVARMVRAVEGLEGTVKDLAGDGILALFGAPIAHEDDAERAVRVGLRITEEIREYGAEVERGWKVAGFAVRVGVNTGPVVLGPVGGGSRIEYGATGDPVNTAARLQAAASPGTVLVGESTQRLTAAFFQWGEPETLTVKGKAEPVVAYHARSAVRESGAARGRRAPTTSLVGRADEMRAAGEAVKAVLAGSGGVVFVTGEAGIGKTRLVTELRREFEGWPSEGGRSLWLEGRCSSYSRTVPYGPFRELIREWLGLSADQPELRMRISLRRAVEALLGDRAVDVYPALGVVLGLPVDAQAAPSLEALSPEALRRRVFQSVEGLFAALSHAGPLVVSLDDFHWADATSIELTGELLALPDRIPVLLVLAQRDDPGHESWTLRERAFREVPHRTRELRLEPLLEEADEELLAALVLDAVPTEMRTRLLAAAGGNPFFLEELIRSLEDAGALVAGGAGWRFAQEVPVAIPETVQKVILARLDRLTPACHSALTAASVLGRQFALPLLEDVAGGSVEEPLRELQRLDLIREARRWPDPEYRFKHLLIQETAYGTLVESRRKALHGRAAQALERLFPEPTEEALGILAHHHLAAGNMQEAVGYLRRAGDAASEVYANQEALEHYSEALKLLSELGAGPEAAAGLHLQCGRLSFRVGRLPEARSEYLAALAGARAAGDSRLELQALEALGLLLIMWGGRMTDAIPHLEEALRIAEALGDVPAEVSLLNRLSIVYSNRLRFAEARRYSERAMALAGALGDEQVLAKAMDGSKTVAAHLGDFASLRTILPRLEDILTRRGELWYLQWAVAESSFLPMAEGLWDGAIELAEQALTVNRRVGDRGNEAYFLALLGWLQRARGEYGSAVALGEAASGLAAAVGNSWWMGWSEALLGWTLLELNAVDDAIAHLQRGLREADEADAPLYALRCAGQLALGYRLAGDRAAALAARERAEQLLDDVSTPPGMAFLHQTHASLAVAAVRLADGEVDRAERLVSPLAAAAERSGWAEIAAAGSRLLGDCRRAAGDDEGAVREFRRALAAAARGALPGEEWRARAGLAAALFALGEAGESEEHVQSARQIADRLAAGMEAGTVRDGFREAVHAALALSAHPR